MIGLRRSETIDTGDTGNDDDIVSFEEGAGSGMAHLIDVVIDERVFLDIGVAGGI